MWFVIIFSIILVIGGAFALIFSVRWLVTTLHDLWVLRHSTSPCGYQRISDGDYIRIDDASGKFIGWYDKTNGVAMNRTKTAAIYPDRGGHSK